MTAIFAEGEQAKREQELIDFEDMLAIAADAISDDESIAAEFRDRYRFFTVDEFQDVNPAQQGLLDAWLADRDDQCVAGDDDQTIYRFTAVSPYYLTGLASTTRSSHSD